ncbi:Stp1/IreP family PP2C-type Ser/Thr phosphatase [Staphylococcus sp. SQ8-PEA]|uniref:Stp1/IreP family PP2C-type Ser/Thr phosphatase n=1 Tax=Staphylococcus marylandisciuri TaxID=2981529 RepID=A0ABT2QP38_9STAP|nr:Stp1/IreP family PP2C-type Ser/Thr phosphatase [Staphylococcus marylandisciuri]MCU5745750.1 Stp1/IreP family PP2C-type Ser/Thr phosphatase [Staphylococcus marylandisciuri]
MLNAELFTDAGQYREKNEDAGGIFYNKTEQQLLVICDGMGGHQAGEVASQFVTEALRTRFEEENYIEPDQAETWLNTTLKQVNRDLYEHAEAHSAYHGMGTTCVCAMIYDNHIIVANIGDSRAYLFNSRETDQITSDHSFVNHLVMSGQISEEEAFHHPQRNIITKVMGTDRRVTPDLFTKKIKFFDYLVLCTDGLTDYVRNHEIQAQLADNDGLNSHGKALLALSQQHGSKDNVSFIIAEIDGDKV